MKKINKLCLILILSIFSVYIFYIVNTKSVKAYDSIDSTGATVWDKTSEEIVDKYGVHYSHMTGVPTTSGNKGSEKNVNYFSMKTDGENSKLVTWIKPMSNGSFGTSRLTSLAKDYEANNPGWIVVAGINADQWYYGTNKYSQKGGYFFFSNQTYYPLTVGGQNLFTISPLGISGNGIGITNDSTNPFIDASGSSNVLIKIYDDADTLIASYPVDGYNQTPSSNQTMVWSGRYSEEQLGNFIPREVSTTNDLYIVEYAELAYMNNSRDYAYEGTIYAPVDSFYGRGNISTIDKATTLKLGQFAIETTNEELKEVLDVGVKVIVEHQYAQESVNDLESVTGYHTNHVKNGQYQPLRDGDSYNSNTRPRSIFGIKEDGTYFLMTTRDALDTSLGGTTYTETNAILDYYDAYTAYQDDGGGSVTAIYRNNEGSFDVVSESCDPGVTERNICTGLFFVIRDPGYTTQFNNSTPTTIELNQKHTAFAKEMEDVQFIIENKTYDAQGDTTIIENLKENTEYEIIVKYKYQGKEYQTKMYAQTKAYYAGLNFIPRSHGFIVEKYQTDEVLRTVSASIKVGEKVYEMGDVERYEIEGLLKNASYEISYKYVVENQQTKERYEKESEGQTYQTLSYEIPEIESFEIDRKTSNKISIKYGYTDIDKIVKEAYIQMNEEIRKIGTTSGIETFEGINTYKEGYEIKLVIKYEDESGRIYEIESEKIEVEKEACEHEYDNECDEECNRCGEKREAPHRWEEASCEEAKRCRRCGKTEGEALGHDWEEATYERPKECTRCGKTEGEALKRPGEPAEEKGCKKCSKTKVISMLTWIGLFSGAIVLLRKKK